MLEQSPKTLRATKREKGKTFEAEMNRTDIYGLLIICHCFKMIGKRSLDPGRPAHRHASSLRRDTDIRYCFFGTKRNIFVESCNRENTGYADPLDRILQSLGDRQVPRTVILTSEAIKLWFVLRNEHVFLKQLQPAIEVKLLSSVITFRRFGTDCNLVVLNLQSTFIKK